MAAPPTQLHKGLKQRHLTMIAIGGVIGAGLFVGSGVVINGAGPAAFLSYAITGVLIIMVMRMLGEMATANPSTGSFADYARKALEAREWMVAGLTFGLASNSKSPSHFSRGNPAALTRRIERRRARSSHSARSSSARNPW